MKIFKPYEFNRSGLIAKNRIALAPMTNQQSNDDGTLSNDEYKWLKRRADEGFGVIFTCAAHVSRDGQGWPGELGIWDDKHIEGLQKLADGIQEHGSLGIVQLYHGGARSPLSVTGLQPWSASAHVMMVGKHQADVREATIEDIYNTIDAFVEASIRALKAGFSGVELHGAHGYLLHQFLSTKTNQRSDDWGNDFEGRTRLLRTIVTRLRSKVPASFLIGVRLSPEDKYTFEGIDIDESIALARHLVDDGVDFIDISTWNAFKKPEKYPEGDQSIITMFRNRLPADIPLFVAGEIWSAADAGKVMELGADFVSLGRVAIGIPDWPKRAIESNFEADRPPYKVARLQAADLSDSFIEYMKKWQGFVAKE